MKRLLKSKRGMSLMEILVALSLLMIVIVGTTPVMLQAYDGLYTAGEYTQNVYNAKTEVEDQLATRSSTLNYKGFVVNFEGLGEVARVNAKRAVSSLKNSLETLFTGAKVRIYISSGSEVDDNQSNHSITLQTVNLEFDSKDDIGTNGATLTANGKRIDISAYLPDKDAVANTAAAVYTNNRKANVTIVDGTTIPTVGRIGINISSSTYPIDFTTSPIKIVVTYLDENDNEKKVHTYLTIKTPTIMLVGETNENVQYYTSAGVVETKDNNGNVIKRQLEFEGRRMNIGYDTKTGARSDTLGAASTQAVPAGTVFKSVNWITEYARTTGGTGAGSENVQYANTIYEPEYYVLTGTNGAIYRTYSFDDPGVIKGKVDINNSISDFGLNGLFLNSLTHQKQIGKDVMGIRDTEIYLDDRASTVVYPAVWGGDFSHIFGWSAYGEEAGYTERVNPANTNGTWYTQHSSDVTTSDSDRNGSGDTRVKGIGSAGFYSNLACYGYYYNGYALDAPYFSMNSRKISYILTEVPESLRVGGYMGDVGSASNYGYDGTTFDRIWERPMDPVTGQSQKELGWSLGDTDGGEWFYAATNESIPRSAILRIKMKESTTSSTTKIPIYLTKDGSVNTNRADNGMAQIRIKALTTLSPTIVYSRGEHADAASDMRVAYDNDANYSKITVTDAVYIPAVGDVEAQVFYVGTVAAYSMINQADNVGMSDDSPDVSSVGGHQTTNAGRLTSYWVVSNDEGTSTTIYKHSTKDEYSDSYFDYNPLVLADIKFNDLPHSDIRARLMDATTRNSRLYSSSNTYGKNSYDLTNAVKMNSTKSHQFFISQPLTANNGTYTEQISGRIFSDVSFTMGYTSNRELLYTNIVYGKEKDANGNDVLIQSLKFCEPYYFLSHYNDVNHNPNLYMNWVVDPNETAGDYMNKSDNDYYNVWFPGEMYNLTKTATKDNVTVAVGYAVAGSTYSYLNTFQNGSTGLGSIYNDGVISGMVLGEDNAFKSLLYFKDNASMDKTSLSDGSVKFEQHGTSGQSGSWVSYSDLGFPWDYGTHARDSVQFTCVDISVVQSGDTSYYYAYYADNKGRVFRSLVATRGKDDAAAEMVEYISDKSTSPGIEDVSYMEEQTILHNSKTEKIGYFFESIKSINSYDDVIIITGHSRGVDETDGTLKVAVGVIDKADPTKAPEWKIVKWLWANYVVYDTLIQDGYVYLVGENIHTGTAFVFAVALDMLKSEEHYSQLDYDNTGEKDVIFWENYWTSNKVALYAIAGKSGN